MQKASIESQKNYFDELTKYRQLSPKRKKIVAYLLYGSVASLPSPSSNIEAWPHGTSLRFAPAFKALGVCEHI